MQETIVPYAYREAWLAAAVEHFKPDFEAQSYPLHKPCHDLIDILGAFSRL
jgi:hypothetical protein